MNRDFNFTFLTGTIISPPNFIPLINNKKALIFTIENREVFQLGNGRPSSHKNLITVEVLGKNADKYAEELSVGSKIQVVGYIRTDTIHSEVKVRVRAFRIEDIGGDV